MGILKTLAFIILFVFLFRLIIRVILPYIVRFYFKQGNQSFRYDQNPKQSRSDNDQKSTDDNEYIDYEEVK